MKKNIGILGGSFSPVHLGHLFVAENVLKLLPEINEIWLMPSYKHRFGKDKDYISNRVELLKKIEIDKIKICTYEIDNKLAGGTFDILNHMKNNSDIFQKNNISFIIGSDCVYDFERWKNYKELSNFVKFIIVSRKGYGLNNYNGILSKSPHIILNLPESKEYSSTEIRKRLKENKPVDDLIPKEIRGLL